MPQLPLHMLLTAVAHARLDDSPAPLRAGLLTIHNATHAEWAWYRNQDLEGWPADSVFIAKDAACGMQDEA